MGVKKGHVSHKNCDKMKKREERERERETLTENHHTETQRERERERERERPSQKTTTETQRERETLTENHHTHSHHINIFAYAHKQIPRYNQRRHYGIPPPGINRFSFPDESCVTARKLRASCDVGCPCTVNKQGNVKTKRREGNKKRFRSKWS